MASKCAIWLVIAVLTLLSVAKVGCVDVIPPSWTGGEFIDVYVVAGTHDDVGWLKTPKDYYESEVRNILATSIEALKKDPTRKFMYVEMYYFQRWWMDSRTTEAQRNDLRALLASGQWEFVEGGWVMPDEATPTYSAIIEQLVEGHLFLNQTFGFIPKIGWQIDPFGASNALASLYYQAGFQYHVIDRINYKLKRKLIAEKSMEFMWSTNPHIHQPIFTHILDDNYCMPLLLSFDFEGNRLINPWVTPDNVALRAEEYATLVRQRHAYYATEKLLVLHQCDFAYQNAHAQFDNMDKILAYISAHPEKFNMRIRWAKLSEYFDAVTADRTRQWPTRGSEDFFAYDDNDVSWWTGYYSSRPGLKGLVRQSEAYLRFSDILSIPIHLNNHVNNLEALTPLRRAVSIAQHHDAVAGTETEAVAQDYTNLLLEGQAAASVQNLQLLSKFTSATPLEVSPDLSLLSSLQAGGAKIPIMVFNTLMYTRTQFIKLPVWSTNDIAVFDHLGSPVTRFSVLKNLNAQDLKVSPATLFVEVPQIPAGGWKVIFIGRAATPYLPAPVEGGNSISNQRLAFNISHQTGLVDGVLLFDRKTKGYQHLNVTNHLMAYESYTGWLQPSGAYIFHPKGPASSLSQDQRVTTKIRSTPYVKEIYQEFTNYASQTIRLFDHQDYAELSYWIGPIPGNTELITRWKIAHRNTSTEILRDNNGFMKASWRKRDENHLLPIPANYYPTVYRVATPPTTDHFPTLEIALDRSHGVSNQVNDAVEIMLHRRTLQDDWRGVGEALNDTSIINPHQRLAFGADDSEVFRNIYEQNFEPIPFVITNRPSQSNAYASYAPFKDVPRHIHIPNFRMLTQKKAIVQVTCLYTSNGVHQYFDVRSLVPSSKICDAYRTNLTGMKIKDRNVALYYTYGQLETFVIEFC